MTVRPYNNLMIEPDQEHDTKNIPIIDDYKQQSKQVASLQDNDTSTLINKQNNQDEQQFQQYKMDVESLSQLSKYKCNKDQRQKGQILKIYKSICIIQSTIICLYFINFIPDPPTKTVIVCIFLLLTSSMYIIWMIFIQRKRSNLYRVDISLCVQLQLGFAIGLLTVYDSIRIPLFLIYFTTLILKCLYYLIKKRAQLSEQIIFSFLSLCFCLSGFMIIFTICDVQMFEGNIIGCFGIAIFINLSKTVIKQFIKIKDRSFKKPDYNLFITFFWFYMVCLGCFFSLSALIRIKNAWVFLTQAPNALFLIITFIYVKDFIIKQKQKFFPISRSLLTSDSNHPNRLRKNITLEACTVCLSEQSMFCYKECMHTCCGYRCIISWLQNGKRQCAMCRKGSKAIVQIKRVNDGEFEIQETYKIKVL